MICKTTALLRKTITQHYLIIIVSRIQVNVVIIKNLSKYIFLSIHLLIKYLFQIRDFANYA